METDAEKRNLGQIATPSLLGAPNRQDSFADINGVPIFLQRGAAPLARPLAKKISYPKVVVEPV